VVVSACSWLRIATRKILEVGFFIGVRRLPLLGGLIWAALYFLVVLCTAVFVSMFATMAAGLAHLLASLVLVFAWSRLAVFSQSLADRSSRTRRLDFSATINRRRRFFRSVTTLGDLLDGFA